MLLIAGILRMFPVGAGVAMLDDGLAPFPVHRFRAATDPVSVKRRLAR